MKCGKGREEKARDIYLHTLTLLENAGQHQKMIRLAKKLSKNFPDDERIKNKLKSAVRMLIRESEKKTLNREYDGAREILEGLSEFNSDEFPVNIKLKEINDEEARFKEHEMKLKSASLPKKEEANELVVKFEKMAQGYIDKKDFDGAVETYITALKIAPSNTELRQKLHAVYMMIANQSSGAGDNVWEKIDKSPADKVEQAKQRVLAEKQEQIMKQEEERAIKLIEEERRIQEEYERKELEIIQTAAEELKKKLDEAQKKEKLKKEEIQRIMREQEAKKREMLERIKREAVEKWKKQKAEITGEKEGAEKPGAAADSGEEGPQHWDRLKRAFEMPDIGWANMRGPEEKNPAGQTKAEKPPAPAEPEKAPEPQPEPAQKNETKAVEENLDSLITTAYIYINQGMLKEAMYIYNKLAVKHSKHPEVKQMLKDISEKEKN